MLVSTPTSTSMLKTVLAFHLVLLMMANLHHDDECGDHAVELRRHHYVLTDFADPPSRLYVVDGACVNGP